MAQKRLRTPVLDERRQCLHLTGRVSWVRGSNNEILYYVREKSDFRLNSEHVPFRFRSVLRMQLVHVPRG